MDALNQILSVNCILGEGCVWDDNSQNLYFVDIVNCTIYSWNSEMHVLETCQTEGPVGCVVPNTYGGIVAAAGHRVVKMTKHLKHSKELLTIGFPEFLRFNDGKCDPKGCLWLGTMAKDQNHPSARDGGSLYCIKGDEVIAQYGGYTIPNGLAWNRDGSLFYHIDTATGCIDVYDVNTPGILTGRRRVVCVEEGDGSPDGMCMDSQGNLWTAMWGAGKVICYEPATGKKLHEIKVPVKHVSCVTFGDRDLKTLYITTAQDENGQGGNLYGVRLPVAGLLPYTYGGREDET